MARRQEYQVILRDSKDYEIVNRPVFGPLKEAKEYAKYLASDDYANVAESTHENMGSDHVDIIDEAGDLIWVLEMPSNVQKA